MAVSFRSVEEWQSVSDTVLNESRTRLGAIVSDIQDQISQAKTCREFPESKLRSMRAAHRLHTRQLTLVKTEQLRRGISRAGVGCPKAKEIVSEFVRLTRGMRFAQPELQALLEQAREWAAVPVPSLTPA